MQALTHPSRKHRCRIRSSLAGALLLATLAVAPTAVAQPTPAQPDPQPPAKPAGQPLPAEPPAQPPPGKPAAPDAAPAAPDAPAPPIEGRDLLAEAVRPTPGGLRPEQVAKRGADTSPAAAAKQAELRAASARVDQAIAAYFPRARLGFSYTRLSSVNNNLQFEGITVQIPVQLNSYQFTAGLDVPLSDYVLRLTQAYATVSLDEDGKRFERRAAELQSALDAEVAYYNWIRTYGQAKVAELAVAQADQHLKDAELTERAGLISKADVLRLQAQRAQALHLTRAALGLNLVTEQQLRLGMHSRPGDKLSIGVDIMDLPPQASRFDLAALQDRALANRLEIKALETAKQSLEEVESIQRAGLYPRVDAFANLLIANPNPRIFNQADEFNTTWDMGVRLSWTINDTFTTLGTVAEANSRVQGVSAQLEALKDGIKLAVVAAYNDLQTAHSAVLAAKEREGAAALALSLRRRLLLGGKATATDIVDADAELTQARLQRINAHVDAHIAYAKLRHAVGGPLTGRGRDSGARASRRRVAGSAGPRAAVKRPKPARRARRRANVARLAGPRR